LLFGIIIAFVLTENREREARTFIMGIGKLDPWRKLEFGQSDMRGFLEDFRESACPLCYEAGTYIPRIDITEDDLHLRITAELPGMKEGDVEVTCRDNILSLRGVKKKEEPTAMRYHRIERSFGEFIRQFRLPPRAKKGDLNIHFTNGLLEIEIDKSRS
jgi:HSP20 family protein